MKKLLTTLLVAGATTFANAQYFQQLYGTTNNETLTAGHNAYQGGSTGHFLVGTTDFSGAGTDLMVERTDLNGTVFSGAPQFTNIYQVSIPGTTINVNTISPHSIEFSNGNGFGIASAYVDPGTGTFGVYFLTLNNGGGITGITGYYPNASFAVNTIIVTGITESIQNNNELYITGFVREAGSGFPRVFIIKVDQAGTIIWSNIYDLNNATTLNYEIPYSIVESANINPGSGTFELMVVGSYMETTGIQEGFVFRADYINGNPISTMLYGNPGGGTVDVFTSIKNSPSPVITATQDGYIIGGYSDANGIIDFWFTAIDQPGNVVWSNLFDYNPNPNTNRDYCYDIIERFNTSSQYEYYLTGYTDNGPFGQQDVMVVKADQNGNGVANGEFWYGSAMDETSYYIDQLNGFGANSDGLAIYGNSDNWPVFGLGGRDHYLVKAYFNGVTACNYKLDNVLQNGGPGLISTETPVILDQWYSYSLNVSQPWNGTESQICSAAAIAAGSNAKEHRNTKIDPMAAANVTIYPNPVESGAGTVDVKLSPDAKGVSEIRVTDLLGRVYYASAITGAQAKIDLPVLKSGSYLVVVTSGNKTSKTILMVK